jgi:hypothetical protein
MTLILHVYHRNTDNLIKTFVEVVNNITIELYGIQSIGVIKKNEGHFALELHLIKD